MLLQDSQFNKLFLLLWLAATVITAILFARTCQLRMIISFGNDSLFIKITTGLQKQHSNIQKHNETIERLHNGSSVQCFGENKRHRTCKFKYLCYSSKVNKYIFFHGADTSERGLPTNRYDPALLDLTSVDDHNTQYFNYVDMPSSSVGVDFHDIEFIDSHSLLFHRFNPDNLMHVIHDDLLPLWKTLRLFSTPFLYTPVQLVMMDGRSQGPWVELYKSISPKIFLKSDAQKHELTCFKAVLVGLSKDTTWYQYGFKVPQGPIMEHKPSRLELSIFAHKFISHHKCKASSKQNVVLISRKQTRRLLNQLDVSIELANFFEKEVFFLDFELQSFGEAVCMMQNAAALVGMHGAELILALFLQPGSTVVELFPYAINPDNYTPYKTLAHIQGLQYIAWQNMDPENTYAYPGRPPEQGGISHLPKSLRDEIIASTEVPRHLCCKDPFWLYRIYQDTIVDTNSLKLSLSKVTINNVEKETPQKLSLHIDVVQETSCLISTHEDGTVDLRIKWLPPFNAKYIGSDGLKYQVLLQRDEDINVSAYELSETELTLKNVEFKENCKLWIRCISSSIVGPLSTTVNCLQL